MRGRGEMSGKMYLAVVAKLPTAKAGAKAPMVLVVTQVLHENSCAGLHVRPSSI